jgi:transposase
MSGPRTNPLHVVVAGTRRAWSREEKRAIIAEAQNTTTSVSAVARRHGLDPSLLFRWRRDALEEERAAALPAQPTFVPLALPAPSGLPSWEGARGVIEIELAGGHRLRADGSVDGALLRSVIEALVGR